VVRFAKIISSSMNDNGALIMVSLRYEVADHEDSYANNTLWTNQLDQFIINRASRIARRISLEVA
jgi:hypothetical protein